MALIEVRPGVLDKRSSVTLPTAGRSLLTLAAEHRWRSRMGRRRSAADLSSTARLAQAISRRRNWSTDHRWALVVPGPRERWGLAVSHPHGSAELNSNTPDTGEEAMTIDR
jgi:hypothetical protein